MKKIRNEKTQETANHSKKAGRAVLPYEVLEAAKEGDSEAMMKVVNHYSGIIKTMAIRKGYDENGFPIYYVDETLRKRLEIAVIMAVAKKFVIA